MRKTLLILAIAAGSMLAPTLLQPAAEAGVFWSIGSAFSVGGLDFALVFGRPDGYWGNHYGDGHYYRTRRPLHYRGYSCHGGCSYRAGYYYHHPDCSIVRFHFRQHRFSPERYITSSPWYYDGYLNRYRYYSHYRYDPHRYDRYRYDRYRYDRYRYDRRRDDHGRYDRNRDRHRDNGWDSDSDRRNRDRGRGDRSYGRNDRNSGRQHGDYRRDDRKRDDHHGTARRRGVDSRSGRGRND